MSPSGSVCWSNIRAESKVHEVIPSSSFTFLTDTLKVQVINPSSPLPTKRHNVSRLFGAFCCTFCLLGLHPGRCIHNHHIKSIWSVALLKHKAAASVLHHPHGLQCLLRDFITADLIGAYNCQNVWPEHLNLNRITYWLLAVSQSERK